MAEFAARVDPFQVYLLQCPARCVHPHGFAESDDALLDARDCAFEEEEVILHVSVAYEAAML